MPPDRRCRWLGIRVVDLGWITAGAGSSALLLDLGAAVVKVEGPGALDSFRSWDGADPRPTGGTARTSSLSPTAASSRSAST